MQYWRRSAAGAQLGSVIVGQKDPRTGIPAVSLKIRKPIHQHIPHPSTMPDGRIEEKKNGPLNPNGEDLKFPEELVPGDYEIKFTSNPPGNMLVFTESTIPPKPAPGSRYAEPRASAVEGTVQHECNILPLMNDEYMRVLAYRKSLAEQPKRSTKELETKMGDSYHMMEQPTMERVKKRKAEDYRKDRLPREEALQLLFAAFEQKEFWTANELIKHTNQPAAFIKELLQEVGQYITAGEHKANYCLKEEFRPVVETGEGDGQ